METPPNLDNLRDKDLRVEIKEWKEKRSLDANAYFHVLVGKIAEAVGESTTETKNQMIADYGQPEYREDGGVRCCIERDDINWRREDRHLQPTTATQVLSDGNVWRVYIVMRGSHTYDTKEMSRLIDGTVSEAQELGIETMTPNEIERLKQLWQNPSSNQKSAVSSAEQQSGLNSTTVSTEQQIVA